jgi:methyl-accepting chemotaxis protein
MAATITEFDEGIVGARVQDRRAQFALNTTRIGMRGFAVISALMFVAWVFLRQYTQLLVMAGGVLIMTVAAWLYPHFSRRRLGRVGTTLFLSMVMSVTLLWPVIVPELLAAVPISYILMTILGNLLLGDRGGRWVAIVGGLGVAADYILVNAWAPQWFSLPSAMTAWVISAVVVVLAFSVTALIVRTVTLGQEESYMNAQRVGLVAEKRADGERAQREHLQATAERCIAFMAELARGNLSARLPLDEHTGAADDPLILLQRSLNDTAASLQGMVVQTRDTAGSLTATAGEILAATTQQARGAGEQSAAIAQASTTIDEIRTIAEQTAQRANGVTDLAQRTVEVSRNGQQAISTTIAGMEQIKEKVTAIAAGILALSAQAQAVDQIITTVSELAAKSNLLALNAAVEAARAGETGRGFAVVAGEMRNLAGQSRAATLQVREILSRIQSGVSLSVLATEEGRQGAEAGVSLAREAGEAIVELGDIVTESSQAATQIAAAAGQQLAGMEQIVQAMGNIGQATAQNVAGAQQAEEAANELNSLAGQLHELVEQYRL